MLRRTPVRRRGPEARSAPSHYDVLGVGRTADSLQIRAAYVRLLKGSHPDSAPIGANSRFEVERLIAAYKVLKDDRLRAAYDQQLLGNLGGSAHWRPAPPSRQRRRKARDPSRAVMALSMLVLVVAALALAMFANGWAAPGAYSSRTGTLSARRHEDIPTPRALEPVAELAARLPVPEAAAFSRSCFAKAARSDAPSAADRCIAFDTAFIYWQQGVGGTYVGEPYFQAQAEAARTQDALERLNPDAAMVRAASIRASTFEALLKIVDASGAPELQDAAETSSLDAQANVQEGEPAASQFETPAQ